MDIAYCMTRNLYRDFRQTVKSLQAYNKANLYVLAEDDAIDGIDADVHKFDPSCFINYGYLFTVMSLARMCLPDYIQADKVLYLDVDTIVCDDLSPLWDIDLTGKWFAAVAEQPGRWNPWHRPHYFNAGVMLMNLKQMREDNATEKIVKAINNGRYRFGEQDAINHMFYDKIVEMPLRYNESLVTGMTNNPAIVHYAGEGNWQTGVVHRKEYRDKWMSV